MSVNEVSEVFETRKYFENSVVSIARHSLFSDGVATNSA